MQHLPNTTEQPPPQQTAGIPARVVRANKWLTALAMVPLLFACCALIASLFNSNFLAAVLHPTFLGLISLGYVLKRKPFASIEETTANVNEAGLHYGEQCLPHEQIETAMVAPSAKGGTRVRLGRRGWKLPLEIDVPNATVGRQLLYSLGHDVSQRAATFRTMSQVHQKWWYGALLTLGSLIGAGLLAAMLGSLYPPLAALGTLCLPLGMSLLFIPSKISVGSDVVVIRWLGYERVIDTANIAYVRTEKISRGRNSQTVVLLTLANGEEVRIPAASHNWDADKGNQLAQRIIDACHLRGAAHGSTVAELRRNNRDIRSWLNALRSLGQGSNTTHRKSAVEPERLWRVVEDVAAPAADRAAAAVALRDTLDGGGRARLQVAARATAGTRLRIALDTAAQPQAAEEELASALEELEAEAAKKTQTT